MEKLINEIDEVFNLNLSTAFDRSRFLRRKTAERRLESSATKNTGQVERSENDRRILPDRRRRWRREPGGIINVSSWEV